MSFCLLLAENLGQWVHHIQHGVDSLYLDELLLKVFAYDVKLPLYVLGLLMRLGLLSKGYGIVIMQYSVMISDDMTSSFIINLLIRKASLAASKVAMYLAFMVNQQ